MQNYYQRDLECMSREDLKALQEERLLRQVRHVYDAVPYYREKMQALGLTPDDITCLDDIQKLPFLTKEDLRCAYPDGLLACPKADCVRVHSTSGTTGRRVIAYYTQHDLDLWSDCTARALTAAGATPEDVVQIAYGYGLFTGGAGLNDGSHKLGCLTVPMSSGNTERQLQFMADLGTTVLCCTPSYAEYLGEVLKENPPEGEIRLKAGIFGAEAWTEEMRRDIQNSLGLRAYDIYGLTELSGPGVAFECSEQHGMHINEDHFLAEIINPATGEVLPDGEKGELVFTSLTKEAFPLIRYRTKDICILSREKCACGRTLVRMTKPLGRSDDMLIVKGVNVFPSQIETVLLQNGYTAQYLIIVDRVNGSDRIEVQVEMPPDRFTDSLSAITVLEGELSGALKTMLGISVKVRLVSPKSIERSEGKAKRVIDRRELYQKGTTL